jgi:hypothetical protein
VEDQPIGSHRPLYRMPSPNVPFTGNPRNRRIAAFGASLFPLVHQEFAYELVRDLGDRIDAEVRFVHTEPADPGDGQGQQMRWLGHGLLAPMSIEMMRADLAHFRDVDPARLDALLHRVERVHEQVLRHARARAREHVLREGAAAVLLPLQALLHRLGRGRGQRGRRGRRGRGRGQGRGRGREGGRGRG